MINYCTQVIIVDDVKVPSHALEALGHASAYSQAYVERRTNGVGESVTRFLDYLAEGIVDGPLEVRDVLAADIAVEVATPVLEWGDYKWRAVDTVRITLERQDVLDAISRFLD